jgi:nicotinate-nucleotide adenylyltransferase
METNNNATSKTIAVLGGSFNPPHEGHLAMGKHIYETLGVDEIWMMFSVNRFKDPALYAPVAERMKMGEILAAHYPDIPFVMTDIEDRVATNETYLVLQALKSENPDHHFIWVMGADNLIEFHTWAHADEFIEDFPIAIVDRPPYTEQAKDSLILKQFSHLKTDNADDLLSGAGHWCFVGDPELEMSSTHLLKLMRSGKRNFNGPFQDVANYILQKGLYGFPPISAAKKPTPPKPF